ncbi:hypothetical protein [Actinoplanes lobatus]|uniref:Ribosomal protein L7/L12 n=1 Tax=Actinoplanes lobatus TaxID=113568 RepID=A0A7W7HHF6_9ACTN|nr:hypothetical protein [Actinoplanes lobatus]MBB4750584.1 ribosomal protein L7/L12 [Actinoplanes lobatus]GIE45481.1 hypothetical protein Alo02nite_83790 [Actinoplanes lobatus]
MPFFLILFVLVGAQLGNASRDRARTSARLAAVERKLDLLLAHLNVADPDSAYPDVLDHLRNGRKIQAIKAYREHTGATLADAKAAIDRLT